MNVLIFSHICYNLYYTESDFSFNKSFIGILAHGQHFSATTKLFSATYPAQFWVLGVSMQGKANIILGWDLTYRSSPLSSKASFFLDIGWERGEDKSKSLLSRVGQL